MDFIIKLFASISILAGLVFLIIFIISIVTFCNARKNSDVRMSFKQFRRIYNLSPDKWCCDDDYTIDRKEYIKEQLNGIVFIQVSVSMKSYFVFFLFFVLQF